MAFDVKDTGLKKHITKRPLMKEKLEEQNVFLSFTFADSVQINTQTAVSY